MAFRKLELIEPILKALAEEGYTTPTPIQQESIPLVLERRDLLGCAQTGTGKTAAFAIPILQLLHEERHLEKGPKVIKSLILTPTRELAIQVCKALHDYGRQLGARVLPVYGGDSIGRQIGRLQKGIDVVVSTPGRLLDLIERKAVDLSHVRTVVLDEADEMLSMGFIDDIEAILKETPANRQTALFSATVPPAIRRLAERYLRAPQSIAIGREQVTVAAIEQRHYMVHGDDKLAALTRLFEVEPITSALIFVRTRAGAGELAVELSARGFPAEGMSGELEQEDRERVLNRFRRGQTKVLVATDVAARGLDIEDISHVFNYDLPEDPEIYVHRIGRTGRAGKTGIAISLVIPAESWRLGRIEGFTRQRVPRSVLPTVEQIEQHREQQLLDKVSVWLKRGRLGSERQLATTLVEGGYDPLEIAAAALRHVRTVEGQRPILPLTEVAERRMQHSGNKSRFGERSRVDRNTGDRYAGERNTNERPAGERNARPHRPQGAGRAEPGMVSLSLNTGSVYGARPADVVSTLAFHANIPGHSIGKIQIQERHTVVDIPEQFVAQVMAKASSMRIRRQAITVERA